MRRALAERLRAYLSGKPPDERVFRVPPKTAKMLRADLEAAGVPYRDEHNRVADFHSLRHTFITRLVRAGVHPRLAQELARHSSITLTMDHYSHTVIGKLSSALESLPDVESEAKDGDRLAQAG
jgi:integrase/recombinase XerD